MYDEDLIELEDGIRRLKIEYDIFFNGHRKKPPDDLRYRIERLVKRLSEANLSFQERFRYNTLIGRFYVYRDLWRRNQTERELGTATPEAKGKERSVPARGPSEGTSVSIADPEKEEGKVRHLFDTVLRIRSRDLKKSSDMSYEQFVRYIARQTQGIRRKYGCASVVFTVSAQADTIKFTAKAGKKA